MDDIATVRWSNVLKSHWQIVLLSALIGLVFILPHLYLRTVDAPNFSGIDVLRADAETHYVARIQEVYDGHPYLGSTYLWEGKDRAYLTPPFLEIVIAYLGKLLRIDAVQVNILAKFLFGFLLSMVVYATAREWYGDKYLALLAAPLTLLASSLLSSTDIRSVFALQINDLAFLRYARPVNPAFSSLALFGYLFFLHRLWKQPRSKNVLFCTVVFGLTIYAYVYFWTYLFVLNGVFACWYLYRRNWVGVRAIVLVSLGAVVLALPYFLYALTTTALLGYHETAQRLGFFADRVPMLSNLMVVAALLLIFAYRKKLPSFNPFVVITLAAAVLVINHQVLTGVNIQNAHYHWYVVTPLAGLAIFSTIYFLVQRSAPKQWYAPLIFACLALFFLVGFITQAKSYFSLRATTLYRQRYAPVMAWLNQHAPADSVVFASDTLSELIPAYTSANVYHSAYAPYYLNTRADLQDRFFLRLYLMGVTRDSVRAHLDQHRDETAFYLFGLAYRYTAGCSTCFGDEVNEDVAQEYGEFLRADAAVILKQHRLNYVVWDTLENPDWRLPERHLKSTFEGNQLVVYEVP